MPSWSVTILLLIPLFPLICQCLPKIPMDEQNPLLQVKIPNGIVQGKNVSSAVEGEFFYAFLGIPYAQPPIKELRFKSPQPVRNWSGILDARQDGSICAQLFGGTEDCLFINVYTPYTEKENKSLLPVMVWIHGGGFAGGDSKYDSCGPDFYLQHNIVVASFNYRLAVFGFLSTEDMVSPGNYGLKDQVAALKWVQGNIRYFGGDPSQVTITGLSAGAASVHYLLQTPHTRGLFRGAISASGSSLCDWSFKRNPKKMAFTIGAAVGILTNNTEELIRELRKVDEETLLFVALDTVLQDIPNVYDEGFPFGPSFEPQHEDAVVNQTTYKILISNQFHQVPLLTGFTSNEIGALSGWEYLSSYFFPRYLLPSGLVHKNMDTSNFKTRIKAGRKIKSFYYKRGLTTILEDLCNFLSDDEFVRPIYETARLHSQSVPVYLYRFSYTNNTNEENKTKNGPMHGEDLRYLCFHRGEHYLSSEFLLRTKLAKIWTNFVKTGNPTPSLDKSLDNIIWPTMQSSRENTDNKFVDIDNVLTVDVTPNQDAMEFWDRLYKDYELRPADTY